MKRAIKFSIIISFLIICLYFSFNNTSASKVKINFLNEYEVTDYKSFTQIRKICLSDKNYIFGLSTAQETIKTKFGNKKAFIIKQELPV